MDSFNFVDRVFASALEVFHRQLETPLSKKELAVETELDAQIKSNISQAFACTQNLKALWEAHMLNKATAKQAVYGPAPRPKNYNRFMVLREESGSNGATYQRYPPHLHQNMKELEPQYRIPTIGQQIFAKCGCSGT